MLGWNKAFGTSIPKEELEEIVKRIDVDNNGIISYSGRAFRVF